MNRTNLINILKADYIYYKNEIRKLERRENPNFIRINMYVGKRDYIKELLVNILTDSELMEFDKALYDEYSVDDL